MLQNFVYHILENWSLKIYFDNNWMCGSGQLLTVLMEDRPTSSDPAHASC